MKLLIFRASWYPVSRIGQVELSLKSNIITWSNWTRRTWRSLFIHQRIELDCIGVFFDLLYTFCGPDEQILLKYFCYFFRIRIYQLIVFVANVHLRYRFDNCREKKTFSKRQTLDSLNLNPLSCTLLIRVQRLGRRGIKPIDETQHF